MTTTPRPWEQTIEEYLDGCSVSGSADRPFSADDLRRYADQTDYTHHATSGDYVFNFNHHQSFRITHAPTGEVAGAFAVMMAYVSPEHRGKNLTALLYVMCDDLDISRKSVRMLTSDSLGAFHDTLYPLQRIGNVIYQRKIQTHRTHSGPLIPS